MISRTTFSPLFCFAIGALASIFFTAASVMPAAFGEKSGREVYLPSPSP